MTGAIRQLIRMMRGAIRQLIRMMRGAIRQLSSSMSFRTSGMTKSTIFCNQWQSVAISDLRNDEEHDLLPLADAAHPVSRLRVITEDKVRREGEDGIGCRRLWNIGAGRVDLIIKGEAPLLWYTALLEGHGGTISGKQWQSVAISGNQRQSVAIDETHLLEGHGRPARPQDDLLRTSRDEIHNPIVLLSWQTLEEPARHLWGGERAPW